MFILKQLRRKKNINQTQLAQAIGVSLRTIQLYEKKDANIPIKNLTRIAQFFDVSIAELYSQERVNDFGAAYELMEKPEKEHRISKLAPGKYLVLAPLLLAEQQVAYAAKRDKKELLPSLPRISFIVDKVSVGRYMAFEISNSSMDDGTLASIPFKAVVLGKGVPLEKIGKYLQIHPNAAYILVSQGNIMCKAIAAYDKKNKTLLCKSRNSSPEYADFDLAVAEIEELYMVLGKQMRA